MVINKKNIAKDFLLNVISNALPVIALQLIVQPYLALKLGADENGVFITVMSLLHFVVMLLGATLHTTRLLVDNKYRENGEQGDFNIGLLFLCLPCFLFTTIGCFIIGLSVVDTMIVSILSIIWMAKDYAIVEYRLRINYSRILMNNTICSLGYIIGIFFFSIWPFWYVIILSGTLLSFIYTILSTSIFTEPFFLTNQFKSTAKSFGILFITESMKVFVLNFDRFVIFAMMSGAAVSIYYSASIMGKLISMVSVPIGNVVLSYLVNVKSINKSIYNQIVLIIIGIGLFTYFISITVSPYLLEILYPEWADQSKKLILLTCGVSFFELVRQLIGPFIIRFCDLNFQPKIYGIYAILYIIVGTLSLKFFDLIGFTISYLFISAIVAFIVWYIGYSSIEKKS